MHKQYCAAMSDVCAVPVCVRVYVCSPACQRELYRYKRGPC